MADDERLLSIIEEIGVIDARMVDTLSRVETGESGATWAALQQALHDLRKARATNKTGEMHEAMAKIEQLIERGGADTLAWNDVRSLIDQKARLARSELSRLEKLESLVPVGRVLLFVHGLLSSVSTNMPRDTTGELTPESKRALSKIHADTRRLLDPTGTLTEHKRNSSNNETTQINLA